MITINAIKSVARYSAFFCFGVAVCAVFVGGMFCWGQPDCNLQSLHQDIFANIEPYSLQQTDDNESVRRLSIRERVEQERHARIEYYKSQISDEEAMALNREHMRFGCRLQAAGFSGAFAFFALTWMAAVFAGLGWLSHRLASGISSQSRNEI